MRGGMLGRVGRKHVSSRILNGIGGGDPPVVRARLEGLVLLCCCTVDCGLSEKWKKCACPGARAFLAEGGAWCLPSVSAQSLVFSKGGRSHLRWKLVERASGVEWRSCHFSEEAGLLPSTRSQRVVHNVNVLIPVPTQRLSPTEVVVAWQVKRVGSESAGLGVPVAVGVGGMSWTLQFASPMIGFEFKDVTI